MRARTITCFTVSKRMTDTSVTTHATLADRVMVSIDATRPSDSGGPRPNPIGLTLPVLTALLAGLIVWIAPVRADATGPTSDQSVRRPEPTTASSSETPANATASKDKATESRRRLLLGSARNATSQGDSELAHERYKAVLRAFPEDSETRFELVGLLMRWGKWTEAEEGIRKLVASDPANDEYLEKLADILLQRQQLAEATKLLMELSERRELAPGVAIRLARLLAWQKDFARAERVIASSAANEASLAVDQRVGIAQYYIESHQPQKAIEVAYALDQLGVDKVDLHVVLARAHTALGHMEEALEWVVRLGDHPSRDLRIRLDLADDFYRAGHDRLALTVYQQLLKLGHLDAVVMSKVMTAQVRLLDLPGAEATVSTMEAHDVSLSQDPKVQAAQANYFVAVGRHAEAHQLYQQLLGSDPTNVDLQNGFGHLWFSSGDYLRAEAEYRLALAKGPGSTKTIAFLAQSLSKSRRFDEAVAVLSEANGESNKLLIPLVETLSAAGRYSEVIAICDERLPSVTGQQDRARLLVEQGFAKLRSGDPHGASVHFQEVLDNHDSLSPAATYGMVRVSQRTGNSGTAEMLISAFDRETGSELARRMQFADLATTDCDGGLAERILRPALEQSPDNVFLLIRLGESASLVDRRRGTCRDRHYYHQALALQPNNNRARLGLARSYARSQQMGRARAEYELVLAELPTHRMANEELSRIVYRAHGVDSGMGQYAAAQSRLATAPSSTEIIATQPESADEQLTIHTSLLTNSANQWDSYRIESGAVEQRLLSFERSGKWYLPWRPRSALCYYRPLADEDRTNEEALFDLGQVFGAMDYTAAAAGRFCQLLHLNPCHTEARIALRRTQLERSPQWWSDVSYLDEAGRDRLTEMSRTRISTLGRRPLGDENEYLYAGYAHEWLNGDFGTEVRADVALIGARWRICDYHTFFVDAEIADYTDGFSTRPQLRSGLQHRDCRDNIWTLAGFIDNVDANRESINQDIYRRGIELSVYKPHSWRWNVSGMYRWSNYSDDNDAHEGVLLSEYLLCHGCGRRQWRSVLGAYFLDVDEQTVFNPDPLDLSGILHPYWAPDGFAHVSLGLEYKHWLSRHNFKYANQWWWSAYAGGRVDTDGVGYGMGTLRCHRDHCNWLTTGIDASVVQSEVYDSAGVRGYLIVRRR